MDKLYQKLQIFYGNVRKEPDWPFFPDEEQDLLEEWAVEAGLLPNASAPELARTRHSLDFIRGEARKLAETRLAAFRNAVREKHDWFFKILDDDRDIATKWAVEAKLPMTGHGSSRVRACLEELKDEARRIRTIDHTIRISGGRLPSRVVDLETISTDIRNILKYARSSQLFIHHPPLREILDVFVSDGLVPPSLHRELVTELDALAALEPKDFHPGTYGKVQDVIHPSLYPYVAGVSPLHGSYRHPPLQDGVFSTTMRTEYESLRLESKYSWIPSTFRVSDDGLDVRIESYINGLGSRDQYPLLYCLIEKTFLLALPHFERMTHKFEPGTLSPAEQRWVDRAPLRDGCTEAEWDAVLDQQKLNKAAEEMSRKAAWDTLEAERLQDWADRVSSFALDDSVNASSFKGQDLKVIVKVAHYILKPGDTHEGTWHMEGMPHECIIASAIYYYDTDPAIIDGGLGLRRVRDGEYDFPSVMDYNHDSFSARIHKSKSTYQAAGEDGLKDDDGDMDWEDVDSDDDMDEEDDVDEHIDYPSDFETFTVDTLGHLRRWGTSELSPTISCGTVPTTSLPSNGPGYGTGRMLAFPNWIQHKVLGLRHAVGKREATPDTPSAKRKILCFFLIGDRDTYPGFRYERLSEHPVLTTNQVLPQGQGCNKSTLHFLLPIVCRALTGKNLPPELVEHIAHAGDMGLSREDAEKHRRALMVERSRQGNLVSRFNFSLCEH